ncbi:MAG: glycosyltransferase family 4 protein [Atribacterota bacterium]
MKTILCIAGKRGRVQFDRMILLKKIIKDYELVVRPFLMKKKKMPKCDLTYYTHFSMYNRCPMGDKKIASITSHKCVGNIKETVKLLKKFDGVSANNLMLQGIFSKRLKNKVYYTPNGVDRRFFIFNPSPMGDPLRIGWVGNRDRATKNYKTVLAPLAKEIGNKVIFKIIAPGKQTPSYKLRNRESMRDFYYQIDFLLVTSGTEGTPNPALEAMSCGVPVITTRVGNMVDIIQDGVNGFFVRPKSSDFVEKIMYLSKNLSPRKYKKIQKNIDRIIDKWDWQKQVSYWDRFFRDFLYG